MNKNFNKLVAVISILLFAAKGKTENSIFINRNKINHAMTGIRNYATVQPEILKQILLLEKSKLEFGLNLPLTNNEYHEIRKLVQDLEKLNTGLELVPINEMHTSTQEFAAKVVK